MRAPDQLGCRSPGWYGGQFHAGSFPGLMALELVDRILTVAVTATLTSAVWIVAFSDTEWRRPPAATPVAIPETAQAALAPPPAASAAAPSGTLLVPVEGVRPE